MILNDTKDLPKFCRAAVVELTSKKLQLAQIEIPMPKENEILIHVKNAGVNRADIDQREGGYPPPSGVSPILGLEVSGIVAAVGKNISQFKIGDRVMSLLSGGGYSEYAVAPYQTTFKIPEGLSFEEGAAISESYFTIWSNVFMEGRLCSGETLLVHGRD